ncbi:MAG: MarR family transcriptional regulator [Bacteroidota bacterium]|nr:MarR family transcriptional regulator [Bacteroidota bacterium]
MSNQNNFAEQIAELTFNLLLNCQEKESRLSEQLNLTVSEFRTLRYFRKDISLNIKELTIRVRLSGSRLTRILDGLEKKNILTRSIDKRDRRSIIVTLSPSGVEIVRTLESKFIEIHKEILKEIPSSQHDSITGGLRQLLQSLESWLKVS